LTPIISQSRIGSGTRKQYSNKKKYSSLEASYLNESRQQGLDKNISIHGSSFGYKPLVNNSNDAEKSSGNNNNNNNNSSPSMFFSGGGAGMVGSSQQSNALMNLPNRSSNNSVQTYHNVGADDVNVNPSSSLNNYMEQDYTEFQLANNNGHHQATMESGQGEIDEINLLNNANDRHLVNPNNNNNNTKSYHVHFNNFYQNYHNYNHTSNHQQLPPISNSLKVNFLSLSLSISLVLENFNHFNSRLNNLFIFPSY
jgi:hypothetical protein